MSLKRRIKRSLQPEQRARWEYCLSESMRIKYLGILERVINDGRTLPRSSSGEGYDREDYGGVFDGTRIYPDADEGL